MRHPQGVFRLDPNAEEDRRQARLVSEGAVVVLVRTSDGVERQLSDVLGAAVQSVAEGLVEGHSVLISCADEAVSPATAAQMLGVSRPMVGRWLSEGLLADVPVGSHHRIPVASIVALRNAREDAGSQAMAVVDAAKTIPETAARVDAVRSRARKRIAARTGE
ncbi:MAG: helix-turn-helix domain-containing protein [Acidimicrobiales bacterium]